MRTQIEPNADQTLGADMDLWRPYIWYPTQDESIASGNLESFGCINYALRTPGTASPKDFKFSKWLGFVGPYMLNDGGHFLPWGQVRNRSWFSLATSSQGFFIRPDSGLKPFVGQAVRNAADWEALKQINSQMTPDEMVYVGPLWDVAEEYRFFVWEGRIVASTMYLPEEQPADQVPLIAKDLAANVVEVCADLPLEDTFTVDVARVRGVCGHSDFCSVLEFNCFRSSGFYAANQAAIIAAVTQGDHCA